MKREKIESLDEKDLITNLIVSEKYCQAIIPLLQPKYLQLDYARTVAYWIKDYFKSYVTNPGRDIRRLYTDHQSELRDEALQENILDYISKLSKDYESIENINVPYSIKRAREYLTRRTLLSVSEQMQELLDRGDLAAAQDALNSLYWEREKELNTDDESITLMDDSYQIVEAFTKEEEVLLILPGALGKVAGAFHREDFVAITAPMKRGKTWWLGYIGVSALFTGLKVAFFTLEMNKAEMAIRIWQMITGETKEDVNTRLPYFEEVVGDGITKYKIKYKRVNRSAVKVSEVAKHQKAIKRMARGGNIRIIELPAYSHNVLDIEKMLERMERAEKPFIPDVIIVDYADILAPVSFKQDYRHSLDETWKRLRGLAQKRKALVVTASQSGRETMSGGKVKAQNVAEDIRKVAHVTSMIGLNQTEDDDREGIMRVYQLAIRGGKKEYRHAVVLQNLALGKPCIDSRWNTELAEKDSDEDDEEKENRGRRGKRRI